MRFGLKSPETVLERLNFWGSIFCPSYGYIGLDGLFYSFVLRVGITILPLLLVNKILYTFMCDNGTNLLFSQYNDTEHRTSNKRPHGQCSLWVLSPDWLLWNVQSAVWGETTCGSKVSQNRTRYMYLLLLFCPPSVLLNRCQELFWWTA